MGIVLRLLGTALTGVVVGAVVRTRTTHRDDAVLDLEPSASLADVQQAYRDLVAGVAPGSFGAQRPLTTQGARQDARHQRGV